MDYKRRKKKWQKEINGAIKGYEEKTGVKYDDYYKKIERNVSYKQRKTINFNKLIRIILFIIYIILYISLKFFN